tara:strand:+ start:2839 stop:4107 length:1269 start_codon:yes stop_codon:yes gene_type:complete
MKYNVRNSAFALFWIFSGLNVKAEWDSSLFGQIKVGGSASATYDSRVFGIPSNYYNQLKVSGGNPGTGIPINELKSEDDFILKFSPAVYLAKKVSLFKFSGSAGVEIAQYFKNKDKSYVIPVTTFSIDFDETFSKNKRVSNNAKIRFDAVFDLGQSVSASVLEQDLVSYTYFTSGVNVRYNHSSKFGLGGGTNYSIQQYQTGSTGPRPYQDFSTLPISLRAFYIYSEKLDFYTEYSFSRSKSRGSQPNLIDSRSHSVSFGADGSYSSKLSGNTNIGYSVQSYDEANNPDQSNLILGLGLSYKYNSKTTSQFNLSRSFSPSAQGFSSFSTTARVGVSHRFVEDLKCTAYISASNVEYNYPYNPSNPILTGESSTMNTYGLGFSMNKKINKFLSATGGYDYNIIDRSSESYGRHILRAQVDGTF